MIISDFDLFEYHRAHKKQFWLRKKGTKGFVIDQSIIKEFLDKLWEEEESKWIRIK